MPSETLRPLSRLHSAGIAAEARDNTTLQMDRLWPQTIGGVKIEVPEEQFHDAVEMLKLPASEAALLRSPHRGESDLGVRSIPPTTAVLARLSLPIPCPLVRIDGHACGRTLDVRREGVDTPCALSLRASPQPAQRPNPSLASGV